MGSLFQGMIAVFKHASPAIPVATANTALRPCIYARIMLGSCSAVNTWRNSVAPVAITSAGSMLGSVDDNLASIWLKNAAWPAEVVKAPPTV